MSIIHWFRKGLRLHDNQALLEALRQASSNGFELRPVFVLDPWFVKHARVGINRWRFLHETLSALDKSLQAIGSRLFVLRGKPEEVFKEKFKEWNVKAITWEYDSEPYAKQRDAIIIELADKLKVKVKTECGHTLYDLNVLIKAYNGVLPTSYQKFLSVIAKVGPPPKPAASVNKLPDACKTSDESCCYDVPSLLELGVEKDLTGPLLYPGGEAEGLHRLEKHLVDKKWIRQFEKPKTSPNSLSPSTTVLSPYLKFGCLSVRTMYWRLQEILSGGPHSQPPVSLIGQLLWREFFYTCGSCIENFDKMEGNPVCKQIDWDTNLDNLHAWRMGQTGYPFIDAIMTQLHQEGWIHHLARHAVACFLTRGDLYISWEEGQKVFEELLLDADWSLNAGNWLWLSASAFFHQYFRVYSPVAFGKKTDKNGDYIKKYIPALRKFPPAYIYEPWKAPLQLQKAAGCIIGVDYPKRIVDHETAHKRNMERMKQAYLRNQNQGLDSSSSEAASSSDAKDKKRKSQSEVESKTLMKYAKKL